ncbi:MAG: hypothetical protein A4S09_10925 [Proteobacteria bacterium SG_bin7]|nr:MAG: hypothetical protein A4S09_10925 [Proteobacteria bacterium SG_bin7]
MNAMLLVGAISVSFHARADEQTCELKKSMVYKEIKRAFDQWNVKECTLLKIVDFTLNQQNKDLRRDWDARMSAKDELLRYTERFTVGDDEVQKIINIYLKNLTDASNRRREMSLIVLSDIEKFRYLPKQVEAFRDSVKNILSSETTPDIEWVQGMAIGVAFKYNGFLNFTDVKPQLINILKGGNSKLHEDIVTDMIGTEILNDEEILDLILQKFKSPVTSRNLKQEIVKSLSIILHNHRLFKTVSMRKKIKSAVVYSLVTDRTPTIQMLNISLLMQFKTYYELDEVRAIMVALDSKNWVARRDAVTLLGQIELPEFREEIIQAIVNLLISEEERIVILASAETLAKLKPKSEAVKAQIRQYLNDVSAGGYFGNDEISIKLKLVLGE